jgi:hypothetical protein
MEFKGAQRYVLNTARRHSQTIQTIIDAAMVDGGGHQRKPGFALPGLQVVLIIR